MGTMHEIAPPLATDGVMKNEMKALRAKSPEPPHRRASVEMDGVERQTHGIVQLAGEPLASVKRASLPCARLVRRVPGSHVRKVFAARWP
jgi:uncharacterized protein (DUF39 family)